jgi:hypothetical protein
MAEAPYSMAKRASSMEEMQQIFTFGITIIPGKERKVIRRSQMINR